MNEKVNTETRITPKLPHGSRVEIANRYNKKFKESGKSITSQWVATAIKLGKTDVIEVALEVIRDLKQAEKDKLKLQKKLEKALS